MEDLIKYDFNLEEFDNISDTNFLNYVICSTPRSGSTFLAKSLMETKIAGLPHEYFNIEHKNDFFKRWQFQSNKEFIKLLIRHRSSENGVFGIKLHYNQYKICFDNELLDNYFGNLKYIFITRSNKLLQGISLEKAFQTGQWSSEFKKRKVFRFKYYRIKNRINEIISEENEWLKYFNNHNIKPLIVNYEDLENNYDKTILEVINYLGLEITRKIPIPSIKKQRKFDTYLWVSLYKILNILKL